MCGFFFYYWSFRYKKCTLHCITYLNMWSSQKKGAALTQIYKHKSFICPTVSLLV